MYFFCVGLFAQLWQKDWRVMCSWPSVRPIVHSTASEGVSDCEGPNSHLGRPVTCCRFKSLNLSKNSLTFPKVVGKEEWNGTVVEKDSERLLGMQWCPACLLWKILLTRLFTVLFFCSFTHSWTYPCIHSWIMCALRTTDCARYQKYTGKKAWLLTCWLLIANCTRAHKIIRSGSNLSSASLALKEIR